ncbi:hypothetical protein [Corynebacterium pseudodiphtheriticum]|uniref:hypothetical protein n=1 Tax=Corynebacterium pseudodiphtheriticum TaxID=37637 RepID=UPI00254BB2CF|nr:hypothetical protein [Corynebacterium pseudodiphtheriticum]MDK8683448.1 hypothetical protein [Corynebacterium pseudodiphtheriticum]
MPGLVAERPSTVATDYLAGQALAEGLVAAWQLAVCNAESLGGVALGAECVHPLDGVPGGEIFEEEAGQPVGQSGLYCCEFGVLHGGLLSLRHVHTRSDQG